MKKLFWSQPTASRSEVTRLPRIFRSIPPIGASRPSVAGAQARKTSLSVQAWRLSAGAALLSMSAAQVLAPVQAAPAPSARASSGARSGSRGESYVLGPGDALRITVSGYSQFNQEGVVIPPDGTVTLPDFGTLKLTGKTRLGVQRELATRLRRSVGMRNPIIAVSITNFRSSTVGQVILAGDVPRSGPFGIHERHRLSELLAEAGLGSRLEEREAMLTRRGGNRTLNLRAAARSPRGAADIVLLPGDSITVRQLRAGVINLAGDVPRPGAFEMHLLPRGENELDLQPRLSELIFKAGGLRSNAAAILSEENGPSNSTPSGGAAQGRAAQGNTNTNTNTAPILLPGSNRRAVYRGILQRAGQRQRLDPEAAITQVNGPANIRLQAGDFVTIEVVPPPPLLTVYLDSLGDTQLGGTAVFKVEPGIGVLELLTSAGGIAKAPDEVVASVRRGAQLIPLDLKALLLSNDNAANIKLQDGDFIQLRQPDSIAIKVAGRVGRPGPLQVKPGSKILDAIVDSGGLSVPAEQVNLSVLRTAQNGTQTVLIANAADIVSLRDVSTNFALQKGDLINIALIESQTVLISGEVGSPGPIQLREGEGLAELIIRAGGAKSSAALTRTSVKRGSEVISVDALDAVRNGKPLDFVVKDGDVVFLPPIKEGVYVIEAVGRPGFYAIPERGRLTLLDVLAQATPQQNTKTVEITRANEDGSIDRKNLRKFQLEKLRRGTEPNITLSPRDIVFVNSPKAGSSLLSKVTNLGALRFLFPF